MTLEDTRTHEELARMDGEAENAAERMWRQTGREDVMSDRDRAERYKTLLEDARRERDEYRFRAETAEKAIAEQAKEIGRLQPEDSERNSTYCAFCGHTICLDAPDRADQIAAHIAECEKHPMFVVIRENACLKCCVAEHKSTIDGLIDQGIEMSKKLGCLNAENAVLKARVGTLEGLLCRTTEAHLHERSCGIFNAEPCNCLRGKIDAALNPQQETPHA